MQFGTLGASSHFSSSGLPSCSCSLCRIDGFLTLSVTSSSSFPLYTLLVHVHLCMQWALHPESIVSKLVPSRIAQMRNIVLGTGLMNSQRLSDHTQSAEVLPGGIQQSSAKLGPNEWISIRWGWLRAARSKRPSFTRVTEGTGTDCSWVLCGVWGVGAEASQPRWSNPGNTLSSVFN